MQSVRQVQSLFRVQVLVVPSLQGQRTDCGYPERDPPISMQAVEIAQIGLMGIAVVVAVVGEKRQAS